MPAAARSGLAPVAPAMLPWKVAFPKVKIPPSEATSQ